jgi:hypothetical protein
VTDPLRNFELVEDSAEADRFLREAGKTFSSVMLWTKDQEEVVNSRISLYSDSTGNFYVAAPKGFDARKFMDDLATRENQDVFFSISLVRANLFFKTRLVGVGTAGMQFAKPDRLYKVQRRRDLRFRIPDGMALPMEHQDPLFPESLLKRKVIDISAGGLGFLIPYDEEPVYPVGLLLKGLRFTLNGRAFSLDAEIRHVQVLPAEGRFQGVKVGVRFKDIRQADNQWIASYVFDQSRRYFTKIG